MVDQCNFSLTGAL